jgi:UDP-N-acetyl-D-galactosamine dehydrogenase
MTNQPKSKTQILPELTTCTIAVIGLGYVGLPLAVEFAKNKPCARSGKSLKRRVFGLDIDPRRIEELKDGYDRTNEVSLEDLKAANALDFTSNITEIEQADVYIVTVPTPIDDAKKPDLTLLEKASSSVGLVLKARAKRGIITLPLIIYESTVYPGATEEICVPILERESGLRFNEDFACGYSPERINPGDREHRLTTITKVTSGSTPEVAAWVDSLYGSIVEAGTHRASSLRVAEAAKVIENTQRDLNIALVNELAIIFNKMNIDTLEVLEAAGTKWNFLNFRPGLVGGHCIGVDPYYLTYKAEQTGYYPHLILAGRRINDSMGAWIADQAIKELFKRGIAGTGMQALILGFTFKEDCPDIRSTRVVDIIRSLESLNIPTTVCDPIADIEKAKSCYGLCIETQIPYNQKYTFIIVAVAHTEFRTITPGQWTSLAVPNGFILDPKGVVPDGAKPIRL